MPPTYRGQRSRLMGPLRAIVLAALLVVPAVSGAFVTVQGFAPHGISADWIAAEYDRIWNTLAPDQPVSRQPLTVVYFTRAHHSGEEYLLPEWGGGGAVGDSRIIVAIDRKPFLEQNLVGTTSHELTHIVITRIAAGAQIPRWFHEGTAMILGGDVRPTEYTVLSRALFTDNLMPLSSIDSVNSFGQFRAELAYCQSRQAVMTLIETNGIGIVGDILLRARRERDFGSALYGTIGVTPPGFERLARASVYRKFSALVWIADSWLILAVMLVLFVAAVIVTSIRKRRKARTMEIEEAALASETDPEVEAPTNPE